MKTKPARRAALRLKATMGFGLILGLAFSHNAYSDDVNKAAGGNGTPSLDASLRLPPNFLDQQKAALQFNFMNCELGGMINSGLGALGNAVQSGTDGLTGALQGAGAGMTASTPGAAGGSCPAVDSEFTPPNSCEAFQVSGRFSRESFERQVAQLNTVIGGLVCKRSQLQSIQGQLACLQQQAQAMAQQIASMQSAFERNIAQAQQWAQKFQQLIDERTRQRQVVLDHLNGKDGRVGLRAARNKLRLVVSKMPGEQRAMENAFAKLKASEANFTTMKQNRTMALTSKCFNTEKRSNYRCTANGPTVSAKEYLVCRVQQQWHLGNGGVVEKDASTKKRAQAKANALKALLDRIGGDGPTNAKLPADAKNPSEFSNFSNQSSNVLSLADVEARYGKELRGHSAKGIDVHRFVMTVMARCSKRADRMVRREQRRGGTHLYNYQKGLEAERRKAYADMQTVLQGYTQSYSDATSAMPSGERSLDISLCENAQPHQVSACFRQARQSLNAVLTSQQEQFQIDGSMPGTSFRTSCSGINNCIHKLENTERNLKTLVATRQKQKADGVLAFNQRVRAFSKQMATMMSAQSQALTNKLKAMNASLAALGVSSLINFNNVSKEELQVDSKTGVVKPPNNVLNLIGSQMTPPMLDVNQSNFASALQGVGEANKRIESQIAKVNSAKSKMATLARTCPQREIQKMAERLRSDFANWTSARCAYSVQYCGTNGPMRSLASDINSVGSGSLDPSIADTLRSGANACPAGDPAAARTSLDTAKSTRDAAKRARDTAKDERDRAQRDHSSRCTEVVSTSDRATNADCISTRGALRDKEDALSRAERTLRDAETAYTSAKSTYRSQTGLGEHATTNDARCAQIYSNIDTRLARIRSASSSSGLTSSGGLR